MAEDALSAALARKPDWHIRAGAYATVDDEPWPDTDLFLPSVATVAVSVDTGETEIYVGGVEVYCYQSCVCGRQTWTPKGKRGRPRVKHDACRNLWDKWEWFQDAFIDMTERGLYGEEEAVPMSESERVRWRQRLWNLANAANVESDKRELVPER
jgi:hypothetical protein